jgi:glycosyltransferase involved in cell wall biosynthesis
MRIAALIATESISGPGRQLAALAQQLASHDVDLRVLICHRGGGRPPAFADYLNAAGVRNELIPDRGPLDLRMAGEVREHLDNSGAAILQTHGYKATAIGFALRRGGDRLPWIGFYHGSTDKGFKDRFYQRIEKSMLRSADVVAIVAGSQAAAFANARDVRIVPNAVLQPLATRAASHISTPEGARCPRIGVIGRLSHEKGVDLFLRACVELRSRGMSFTARVIGDGPEETSLRRLTAALDLADAVHFTGRINDLPEIYEQLDLVVLPSRSEGLPNVLLEALASDIPVVATRVGAVADVLHLPGAGVMVPPLDPIALADGIQIALRQGWLYESRQARRRVLDRFSLSGRAALHMDIYNELTATRQVVP